MNITMANAALLKVSLKRVKRKRSSEYKNNWNTINIRFASELFSTHIALPGNFVLLLKKTKQFRSWRGVLDTTLCDKVCQWHVAGRWFSPGTPAVSSANKIDRHNLTEILLKVELNTIHLNLTSFVNILAASSRPQTALFLWKVNYANDINIINVYIVAANE